MKTMIPVGVWTVLSMGLLVGCEKAPEQQAQGDQSEATTIVPRRKAITLQSISTIEAAVSVSRDTLGRLPKTLEALTEDLDGGGPLLLSEALKDAWGNPFMYEVEGRKFTIRSCGPDGQPNTEDDLTN